MKDFFTTLFAGVGLNDVLDILVVAFIIYKILGFIRETRAQQLVKGLLAIAAAFAVSEVLHLYMLNWIIRTVLTIGVIALIILFQPELRRALEHMGRRTFMPGGFQKLDKSGAKHVIDEMVKAVEYFSETMTGALIVIEREVSLGDIIETGTVLNSEISAEALENIFYKGAPLHDGAVIIRGDKICAAGCVLPLTTRFDLNKELGTRHRAGIGITENSDAVILIVSEENGVISVAQGGQLRRFLDGKEVEKLLLNIYLSGESRDETTFDRIRKAVGGGKKDA
ncbi:MAG: diadenylate cyclase CdaA [Firmicutes bacterium]|nr:diadenylate cyclase CdaA [Eubacterium sp.]MBR3053080.1 diadenylate cyclase CdaA [Bacillota bacterium]